MANVLIGIGSGNRKSDNTPYCYLGVIRPCTERENKYGAFGQTYERIYVDTELFKQVKPENLGKEIVFDYEVSNGRANAVGFKLK